MCKKVVNCFTMVKSNVNPFFTMVKVYQFFPVTFGAILAQLLFPVNWTNKSVGILRWHSGNLLFIINYDARV